MDSKNGGQTPPQQPAPRSPVTDYSTTTFPAAAAVAKGRHASSASDASTICASEYEKRDLESQQAVRTPDRSFSNFLGLASPVLSDSLDDIDEEDLAASENGDVMGEAGGGEGGDRIDDHPNGYPRLSAFLTSDENFLICRQYSHLHARILLYRQDELRALEAELLALDRRTDSTQLSSREREDRDTPARRNLINAIDEKLKEYHDIVMRTRKFASLQKASDRNYRSVRNWVDMEAPLEQGEAGTFYREGDFVAVVDAKEGSWFDGRVENALSNFGGPLSRRLFITPQNRRSTSNKLVRLYSKSRIDIFSRLIITFLAVLLLMAPVVALFGMSERGYMKILVIFLFTMAFSCALSLFTKAKRHEVFAATAAYCAVLVVFLGNMDG